MALAAVLSRPCDVLVLDEPTNHLDSDMVLWLEDHLRKFTGGLIMVTHDRYFLERVCNRITELSHCRIRHYEANYSKYLEQKTQQEEMDQAAQRKRQSILRVEYQWIMRGAQARRTKNKDRIARYEELKAQGIDKSLESIEKDIRNRDYRDMHRDISPLCQAEDAVLVDTSDMDIETVLNTIRRIYEEKKRS